MRHSGKDTHTKRMVARTLTARLGALVVVLTTLGLVTATSASAVSWETVKHFAPLNIPEPPPEKESEFPEDAQLGGVSGMAVNRTGAGGVPPGTIYAVGYPLGGWHVARYSPDGTFEVAWSSFSRCGPLAGTQCAAAAAGAGGGLDVDIDQTTGNVYVFSVNERGGVVREYTPDGATLLASFGELEAKGTVETSPEKLHGSTLVGNIAVNDAGDVYVFDEANSTNFYHRLMVFRPQTPGDYEHYVYAGRGSDIGAGPFHSTNPPAQPVLDSAGHIYVAGENYVEEYDPAQPNTPICSFSLQAGGIASITVNPATGAPFYFSGKDHKVHQLSPCDGEGKFLEKDAEGNFVAGPPFTPLPQRGDIMAMALNPDRQYPGEHSQGVLYAATPEPCPAFFGGCPPGAKGQSSLAYILAPPASHLALVESESVTLVGETSATLNAKINPEGSQTSYVFQYLPEAAYEENEPAERFAGAIEAPLGGAPLGTGKEGLGASVGLSRLSPGTEYRYRVVATNEEGPVPGTAEAFRTFAPEAPKLPDNRAWELVSPAQKNGGEVLPAAPQVASCGSECKPGGAAHRFPTQVTPGGDGVAYQGFPFGFNEGPTEYDEYVSTRSSSGWQTRSLGPPLADHGLFEVFSLAPDLGSALLYAGNPALTPEAPAGYRNLFAQPGSDRLDLVPALKAAPPDRAIEGVNGFELKYAGASADLSRVFFEANDALTGETPSAPAAVDGGVKKNNLYEWSEGQLRLVNVQPGNSETIPGAEFGSGLQLADPSNAVADFSHAISSDGSRVFWSSEGGQVYVRDDEETTREISESQRTTPDPAGSAPAGFLTASVDGSRALFSSSAELTDDAQTGPIQQEFALNATAGTFTLGFKGQSTAAKGKGDLTTLATGTGDLTSGSKTVSNLSTTTGTFTVGESISGSGIAPHTTISEVNGTTLTLSAPTTATGSAVALTSGSKTVSNLSTTSGTFAVGEAISGAGIPAGTTITALGPGSLTLSDGVTMASTGDSLSAALPFNASPGVIQAALESLSTIGAGGVSVSSGQNAFTVTFSGALLGNEELLSADGSGLTGTITPRSTSHAGSSLYEWHEGALTDLSGGSDGRDGFEGIAGQSEDLSQIYFVDTAVLDETPNGQGDVAVKGEDNLYAWQGGSSRFIATLVPGDGPAAGGNGAWAPSPVQRLAEASPDGRYLAFNSKAELTGVDNIGACEFDPSLQEYVGSVPCEEVFLYDSQTGGLTCASCNPVGEHPHGGSFLRLAREAQGYLEQPRYLTDEGRLFFDSRDSLVPHDTNGKVEDVYEYEPEGVGSCAKEGGCVSLISAGHEATDSNFLAMDEDGKNVFFTTRDQLSLKDKDDLIDLYDAREGGGITSETETARSECQGEACQPLYSPPNDPTPSSSSFEGAGNVNETKAPGKHTRRPGKHAGKHKKKRHAKKKHAHKRAARHDRGGSK